MIELKIGDKFVVRSTPLEAIVKNKWNERMNYYLGKTLDVYEVRQSAEGIYYVVENVVFGWHPSNGHIDWESTKKLHEVGKTYEWHEAIKMAAEGTPMQVVGKNALLVCKGGLLAYCDIKSIDILLPVVFSEKMWDAKFVPYIKPITLTDDEKTILRNVDSECKWIARDKSDDIWLYDCKPIKDETRWNDEENLNATDLGVFNHLFQQIKWEDKEPCLIADLIK